MTLPTPNLDIYQRQLDSLRQEYANLQPISAQKRKVESVSGLKAAKEEQDKLPPDSSAVLFDKEHDIFYLIVKDENGKSPDRMTIGRFTLEQEDPRETEYVTRKDFDALKDEIVSLLKQGVKNEQST